MLVQMKVRGLMYDPFSNAFIVILRDEKEVEVLPIWIGKPEASAISFSLEGVHTPRPMTHDLIKNIMDAAQAKIISVVITDLKDNTYLSKIHAFYRDSEYTIDCRPSDAIALALRTDTPIFATETVMQKHNSEEIDRWLESFRPEGFGGHDS